MPSGLSPAVPHCRAMPGPRLSRTAAANARARCCCPPLFPGRAGQCARSAQCGRVLAACAAAPPSTTFAGLAPNLLQQFEWNKFGALCDYGFCVATLAVVSYRADGSLGRALLVLLLPNVGFPLVLGRLRRGQAVEAAALPSKQR